MDQELMLLFKDLYDKCNIDESLLYFTHIVSLHFISRCDTENGTPHVNIQIPIETQQF